MRGEGFAHALGQPHGMGVVALGKDGEAVFAEARDRQPVAERRGQVLAQRGDQRIGRVQADVGQQPRIVVRFDQ